MKAVKAGLGIALGAFIIFAIDQGGITANVVWRSVATGALAGLLFAAFYAYTARRGQGEV